MAIVFGLENSKLFNAVSVANVDAKECVGDRLVAILKLMFCRDFEGKVFSRFKTFDMNFGQDF